MRQRAKRKGIIEEGAADAKAPRYPCNWNLPDSEGNSSSDVFDFVERVFRRAPFTEKIL